MKQSLTYISLWFGVLFVGLFLRSDDLLDRPIHFDEATGARLLGKHLEGNGFDFNPQHFHGPILAYVTAPIAKARGENSWAELSLTTLRVSPIIAGMLLIITPLLWIREIGHRATLASSLFIATSPLIVYYNRMFIHESWLALFGMISAALLFQLLCKPTLRIGALTGLAMALMFATKESFAISVLSWGGGIVIYLGYRFFTRDSNPIKDWKLYFKPGIALVVVGFLVSAFFYTDGFRNPKGIVDAVMTYFVYETTAGHDKAFTYYLELLLWPKHLLGQWWSEGLIAILALVGIVLAVVRKHQSRGPILFVSAIVVGHFLIYSLIGYKTPWLMVLPWCYACLLAGMVFHAASGLRPISEWGLYLVTALALVFQIAQSRTSSGRFANDFRNPYTYVPTSKNAQQIGSWLSTVDSTIQPLGTIAIIGQEYWPLPWYLRQFESVGYWAELPAEAENFSVLIATPSKSAEADAMLEATHTALPHGLRTNVAVTIYLKNDLWDQWIHRPETVDR
ncbi:MAG: flippase activity-associated protein Agl23 [Verrucomicrobiota bacterium]